MSESRHSQDCLNCGAELRGQYCGQCGQRATSRLISLWELLRDAFGDLFELDSRLWRTLTPLLLKPGKLTKDYLEGRRTRYMPPFRMYLVLSLVFFVVAFFDPADEFAILYEQPSEVSDAAATSDESMVDRNCTFDDLNLDDAPQWFKKRLTPERVQAACERAIESGGKSIANSIAGNIPAALIILLPFLAFVLKTLYPLSRRYYVEHLLFFVHFHAFFFLILSLQILLSRLGAWVGFAGMLFTLLIVAASFYVPVYLFMAMRCVYGQGRLVSFLKFVWLAFWYLVGFTVVMLGATLIAVFSL